MWKDLEKRSIALGDVASWNVLMFLKTGTKWQEIQKSELNTIKANELFKFFFHILFYRVVLFLNYFICFAITSIFNFTVNLVTSFSRQKLLKSKIKLQRTIFLEYKVLPSCKVWVHTNKKCKGSSKDARLGVPYVHSVWTNNVPTSFLRSLRSLIG